MYNSDKNPRELGIQLWPHFTIRTPFQFFLLPLLQQKLQTSVETAELNLTRHADDHTVPFYTKKVLTETLHILAHIFSFLWSFSCVSPTPTTSPICLLLHPPLSGSSRSISCDEDFWIHQLPSFLAGGWRWRWQLRANVMCIPSAGLCTIFAKPSSLKIIISLNLYIFVHFLPYWSKVHWQSNPSYLSPMPS